jgi:hypothetical protein
LTPFRALNGPLGRVKAKKKLARNAGFSGFFLAEKGTQKITGTLWPKQAAMGQKEGFGGHVGPFWGHF